MTNREQIASMLGLQEKELNHPKLHTLIGLFSTPGFEDGRDKKGHPKLKDLSEYVIKEISDRYGVQLDNEQYRLLRKLVFSSQRDNTTVNKKHPIDRTFY